MLRTVNAQPTLWEAILPKMCLGMPAELEAVDRLLDDPSFFEPFRAHFHAVLGRPSVPIETYLRLMFLKHRYRLGFEPLCREVADSISWQRFCRIPLGTAPPHATTLMKITTRCGSSAVDGLNEALLAKAEAAKVLKTNRIRADTTVVPANVAYPTDSGLLAKGVAKMAKAVERLQASGLAPRIKTHDRTRLVRAHARSIGANLRRRTDEAKDEVLAINARTVRLASRRCTRLDAWRPTPVGPFVGWATAPHPSSKRSPPTSRSPPSGWRASPPRHGAAWPGTCRTERPDGCRSTTPTPAPSAKVGSASPSSSATRPRSSTTKTVSFSTTTSRSATRPTHPRSFPLSNASHGSPRVHPTP
jgi:IS5 family transposase